MLIEFSRVQLRMATCIGVGECTGAGNGSVSEGRCGNRAVRLINLFLFKKIGQWFFIPFATYICTLQLYDKNWLLSSGGKLKIDTLKHWVWNKLNKHDQMPWACSIEVLFHYIQLLYEILLMQAYLRHTCTHSLILPLIPFRMLALLHSFGD